jgi:DNA mismatch repair protein MutS2
MNVSPSSIDMRTLKSLEWDRLKAYLAREANSQPSRDLCEQLVLHGEPAVVDILLSESAEALSMLAGGFSCAQIGLPDLRDLLGLLGAGGQLAPAEFAAVNKCLMLSRQSKISLNGLSRQDFPRLTEFLPKLHVLDDLIGAIAGVIDEGGAIRDDASPALQKLRKDVVRLTNSIKDELTRIINSSVLSKALQEPIYTQRDGRWVLPVNASMRQSIGGIVHDSSASGLTVYVEPYAVVEITNKIRLREAEIEREIDRLLTKLTGLAQGRQSEIAESFQTLVELDFIAARASLARKYEGTRPQLATDGVLQLFLARHPLLVLQDLARASSVVPNDVALGGTVRTLVITGPNTGGKTVYLKTAGLLSLMVRAGLLLPVKAGSKAAIFTQVFADIGDEQSLEQSLSTFSSHLTNIVEVINRSGPATLVLLDEVGAGTDPREGSTLARVILDHLNECGASTIATTHFGELKTLAYTQPGFMNASLEFDEQTLSPTYRLRLGVPGSSKAMTIARRLGLKPELVEKANQLLSSKENDVTQMISQLESRLHALSLEEEELRKRVLESKELEAKALKELDEISTEKESSRQRYANQLESEYRHARDFLKSVIAGLQKGPDMALAQKARADIEKIRDDLGWKAPCDLNKFKLDHAQVGQKVRIRSLNQRGVVEAVPEDGGRDPLILVRAGAIKVKVPLSDLLPDVAPLAPSKTPSKQGAVAAQGRKKQGEAVAARESRSVEVFVRTLGNTLDLRGQRVDEAMTNLEKFVDTNFVTHTSPIMIIHGHGTGAIKAAVRDYLAEGAYPLKFRPGEVYEGGDGVTVVTFS